MKPNVYRRDKLCMRCYWKSFLVFFVLLLRSIDLSTHVLANKKNMTRSSFLLPNQIFCRRAKVRLTLLSNVLMILLLVQYFHNGLTFSCLSFGNRASQYYIFVGVDLKKIINLPPSMDRRRKYKLDLVKQPFSNFEPCFLN